MEAWNGVLHLVLNLGMKHFLYPIDAIIAVYISGVIFRANFQTTPENHSWYFIALTQMVSPAGFSSDLSLKHF